jgi:pimeloyl-ACP methyl ester carboxylesterase
MFAISPDGKRVAYDVTGTGPAIILLHGGGGSRLEWHQEGYVQRLLDAFTVITVDLRGHGESALPTDPAEYSTEKQVGDILSVADACGVERFFVWGMSYGGNVGRYLAVQSGRVDKIVMMGATFGPGVWGKAREEAQEYYIVHWPPILQALRDGTLDVASLSSEDQDFMREFNVQVTLARVGAMLGWPAIEPADMPCPTLWLVGIGDDHALANARHYEASLPGSRVQLQIVEGLDHDQLFQVVDTVFPTMLAFTRSPGWIR